MQNTKDFAGHHNINANFTRIYVFVAKTEPTKMRLLKNIVINQKPAKLLPHILAELCQFLWCYRDIFCLQDTLGSLAKGFDTGTI